MAAEGRTRRLDRAVAALAERQHAVVAWLQLAMLGMTRHGLHTRVAAGRLHRLHRGVYSVVARRLLRIEGHWLAAVFAVGEGAVLSISSADLEEQFLALCDGAGLPRPQCNVPFTLPNGTEISIDALLELRRPRGRAR